jgi:chitinase
VIASFGGASGSELTSCSTVATMQAQYKKVIDQFNLTRIDLDIEGATLNNTAANDRRNTALANLQTQYAASGKTLAVNYTLPVNPTGLESNSLSLLNNAKSHNLNVNAVNIMTMDYGPAMDMGQAAIQAANALHGQLGAIWNTKTSAQLWAMEGNTPMIGVNDTAAEVFTTQDAGELESFAASNGIQMLSFWALGRDNSGSSGTSQSQYQFTNIFKAITGGGTTPPTSPPPTGGSTTFEAEAGTLSAGGTFDSNHLGFTGTGFANPANAVGAYVDIPVTAKTTGTKTLNIRYSDGTTAARPATISVNGTARGTLNFPITANWDTWATVSISVPMTAGANTVRITGTTAVGAANIDSVFLS